MYTSTLSLTSVLGGWSTPPHGRSTPWKDPVPTVQEAVWAPGPVWTGAENLAPQRDAIPPPSSPSRVVIPTELSRATIIKQSKLKNKMKQYKLKNYKQAVINIKGGGLIF
jgi:hypothetical protein